ncbi:MAG TPA: sigma-70 family RNA polymerase sigma factor [Thermoanaerobaculia bacterium]
MELFAFDDDYVRRLRERHGETERHFVSYFTVLLGIKLRGRVPPDAIDDVRQEVFARVFTIIGRGDLLDGRRLGSFVNTVCNNVVFERFRREGRADQLDENYDVADDHDTERAAMERETQIGVRRILAEMPKRDADLLRSVFLDEADKDEVCRRFEVDRGYLRVLLHRAKERFRELFPK